MELERAYRRLIACYPRSFRRESEDEIVAVLLATAPEGQRRPGLAESADLIRGALRMRTGLSRAPRSVLNAVRLMYLEALAHLAALITLLLTEGSIRALVLHRFPQLTGTDPGGINAVLTTDTVGLAIAVAAWLWVAWATGRGSQLARIAAIFCFTLSTVAVITALASDALLYAPACMFVSGAAWLIGLAALVNVFRKQSWAYYQQQAAL